MFSVADAERKIFLVIGNDSGRYIAPVNDDLSIGRGLIYSPVQVPLYDEGVQKFIVTRGPVLVLTHECDIEPGNDKPFNKDVVVLPLVPFEVFFDKLSSKLEEDRLKAYIGDFANGNISQLLYIPTIPGAFDLGAVLYLNRITSTHYSEIIKEDVKPIAVLTSYGLNKLSEHLSHHLLRQKADPVPIA